MDTFNYNVKYVPVWNDKQRERQAKKTSKLHKDGVLGTEDILTKTEKTKLKNGTKKLTWEDKVTIYNNSWTHTRGKDYNNEMAKVYNVKASTIDECCGVGMAVLLKDDYTARMALWKDQYGFCVEVRSPGNDLLEFYDEQNLLRGESQRNYVPPSVIHKIRFSKEYLSTKDIYAIAKPYYDNNPTTDSDWSFYKMLRKERLKWLVDEPSVRKVCYSQEEVNEYVRSQTGAKTVDYTLHKDGGLGWHGKLAGWSFIKKEKLK